MIKIVEGDLFESKANFLIHQVNCQGVMGSGVAAQVAELYPHVFTEYLKYLRYCKKNKTHALGTVQYVPSGVWALMMVDTMKNDNVIDYDTDYQYIVNLFGQDTYGTGLQTSLKDMKKAFEDIRKKAERINASIAMPYNIGCGRGGANWTDVYNMIKEVFENSDIDVTIMRQDRG